MTVKKNVNTNSTYFHKKYVIPNFQISIMYRLCQRPCTTVHFIKSMDKETDINTIPLNDTGAKSHASTMDIWTFKRVRQPVVNLYVNLRIMKPLLARFSTSIETWCILYPYRSKLENWYHLSTKIIFVDFITL